MNPPKPPPTKKEQFRTSASDFRLILWTVGTVPIIGICALVSTQNLMAGLFSITSYLAGSAVTFTAMRSR